MTRLDHPLFARLWPRLDAAMNAAGVGPHRQALVAGLSGVVVEVGAGAGANFAYYPPGVRQVLAIEPETRLRRRARSAAADAAVGVHVLAGDASQLPLADGVADAAVLSLVLCSVDEPTRALAEVRRVLRPGGVLHFYEHVRSQGRFAARAQRCLDLVWPTLFGGCHCARDTVSQLRLAGFEVTSEERFAFPPGRFSTPTSPHVRGTARVG